MPTPEDPGRVDLVRMGPIKVLDVVQPSVPQDGTVCNVASIDAVPFEQVKHLCSGKPLVRFPQPDDDQL